jgi:hypothetical protein
MEPRNDNTWLLLGVGLGCGMLVVLLVCAGAGTFLVLRSAPTASGPGNAGGPSPVTTPSYPPPSYPPPVPPPTIAVPPSVAPLPPTSVATAGDDDRAPRAVHATIESVTGSPGVSVGQTCEFNVERRDREDGSGFWCNAQVVCGGHLLYGGPTAGFFPCTLFAGPSRGVVGQDPNTTSQDRDGAMSIDTVQSHLEVWDDATGPSGEFRVGAHIDSIQ